MQSKFKCLLFLFAIVLLSSCGMPKHNVNLPLPESSSDDMFKIDKNINMSTIDNYLFLDDVEYIDVRMLYDPARFEDIGGESDLTSTITGFKIVPYPYIASLQALPVSNAYNGDSLYNVEWSESGTILKASPRFEESKMILEEVFPKNKKIFLMCGGGGYANMMKLLLLNLGWDENKVYNIGANWNYNGKNKKELVIYPEDVNGDKIYASWRANYVYIPFEKLHKIVSESN